MIGDLPEDYDLLRREFPDQKFHDLVHTNVIERYLTMYYVCASIILFSSMF